MKFLQLLLRYWPKSSNSPTETKYALPPGAPSKRIALPVIGVKVSVSDGTFAVVAGVGRRGCKICNAHPSTVLQNCNLRKYSGSGSHLVKRRSGVDLDYASRNADPESRRDGVGLLATEGRSDRGGAPRQSAVGCLPELRNQLSPSAQPL